MGFALRKQASGKEPSGSVPLKKRFYAWWNGYELKPHAAVNPDGDTASDTGGGGSTASEGGSRWNETRRQLAQELWSPGFVVPGGDDYVEKLVSGCSLTAAETMLALGIGMGGDTRTIISKFGNYVTGYERDEELAAAARRHAVTYDMDDKFEVINEPFEKISLKPGYFRAALLRDMLYTVDDKAGLLGEVARSLKDGDSYLIITDFLFDADNTAPELAAWKAMEERTPVPWTEGALVKCMQSLEITPRIVEDESEEYCRMVVDAWSDYLKTVDGREVSDGMGQEMAREGEFWARRVAALQSGALKYYHIEGVKVS